MKLDFIFIRLVALRTVDMDQTVTVRFINLMTEAKKNLEHLVKRYSVPHTEAEIACVLLLKTRTVSSPATGGTMSGAL